MTEGPFPLPSETLRQLGHLAEELTRLMCAMPEYIWIDTSINVLVSLDGEKPGLDDKAVIGVMEFGDFGEYQYIPTLTPRRRAKTS